MDETHPEELWTVQQTWLERSDPDSVHNSNEIEDAMQESCPKMCGNLILVLHGHRPLDPYRWIIHLKAHADRVAVSDYLLRTRKLPEDHCLQCVFDSSEMS